MLHLEELGKGGGIGEGPRRQNSKGLKEPIGFRDCHLEKSNYSCQMRRGNIYARRGGRVGSAKGAVNVASICSGDVAGLSRGKGKKGDLILLTGLHGK